MYEIVRLLWAAIDLIIIVLFVSIGRSTDDHVVSLSGVLLTTWPFALGWLLATLVILISNRTGVIVEKAPKSDAGRRTIAVPSNVVPCLSTHLEKFVEPDADARLMVGGHGGSLLPQVHSSAWSKARREVGRA